MIRLMFIRHGATAGNLEKRYIGRTDEPLCPLGQRQILDLRARELHADALFVSPMLRTRQTAELLFPGQPYTQVQDFRETDFGIFEGKHAAELAEDAEYRRWVDSFCQGPIPGGESTADFKRRCCRAFWPIMQSLSEGSTAAFVVHGGTIMAILEEYARPKQDFYAFHLENGGMISAHVQEGILLLDRT